MHIHIFIFLLSIGIISGEDYNPCNGKSTINDPCTFDKDCEGEGVQCLRGQCQCHPNYKMTSNQDSDGVTYLTCIKLPDRVGQSCVSRSCASPLFCIDDKCACGRGTIQLDDDDQCYDTRAFNASCSSHDECRQPFMACVNGRCQCISGAKAVASRATNTVRCYAPPNCPFGGNAKGSCTIFTNDRKVIENAFNAKDAARTDSCPEGQFCHGVPGSNTGHCCQATCPLGMTPSAFDCRDCDPNTHFCHRSSGSTFAYAVCCRRPCQANDEKTVYINGQCMNRAALNDECSTNDQCDGNASMMCQSRKCVCKSGMRALTDAYTNPGQVCRNASCSTDLSRGPDCYSKVGVGDQCFIQEQCPSESGCYRGKCMCKCDHRQIGSRCIKITTTPAPTTRASLSGTSKPNLLEGLGDLFKGKGGSGRSGGLGDILGGFGNTGSNGGLFGGILTG